MSSAALLVRRDNAQAYYDEQHAQGDRYEQFDDMRGAIFEHELLFHRLLLLLLFLLIVRAISLLLLLSLSI